MRLYEALDFEREVQLDEGLIPDSVKKKVKELAMTKAEKRKRYETRYKRALTKAKKELRERGFDPSEVEDIAKRRTSNLSPENFENSVLTNQLKGMFSDLREAGYTNSILIGAASVIVIIFVLNAFMTLMTFIAPTEAMALAITAVLMAPIIEEIGKYIAIRRKQGGSFLVLFNIGEFIVYMFNALVAGIPMAIMAAMRTIPIFIHTFFAAMTRREMLIGQKMPVAKATKYHALYNALHLVGGVLTFAQVMKTDDTAEFYQRQMVIMGRSGESDDNSIRNEVVAWEPNLILLQKENVDKFNFYKADLDPELLVIEDHPIDSIKTYFKDQNYQKVLVVVDEELLSKRGRGEEGQIRRWAGREPFVEIIRSTTFTLEA